MPVEKYTHEEKYTHVKMLLLKIGERSEPQKSARSAQSYKRLGFGAVNTRFQGPCWAGRNMVWAQSGLGAIGVDCKGQASSVKANIYEAKRIYKCKCIYGGQFIRQAVFRVGRGPIFP